MGVRKRLRDLNYRVMRWMIDTNIGAAVSVVLGLSVVALGYALLG